jgi:hypothetical protein
MGYHAGEGVAGRCCLLLLMTRRPDADATMPRCGVVEQRLHRATCSNLKPKTLQASSTAFLLMAGAQMPTAFFRTGKRYYIYNNIYDM